MAETQPPETGRTERERTTPADRSVAQESIRRDDVYWDDAYGDQDRFDHSIPVADDPYADPPTPTPWMGKIAKVVIGAVSILVATLVIVTVAPRLAEMVAVDQSATLADGVEAELDIPPGSTASRIAVLLEETGAVRSSTAFEREIRIQGVADQLRAGTYTVTGGMTEDQIIAMLVAGPPAPETYRLTVIEGLRIEEMITSLAAQTPHDEATLTAALLDGSVTSGLLPESIPEDAPPITAWEGLLFPATYDFVEDARPAEILQRLATELETRVARVDWSALEARGLTPYDGIIIASLIEKEAKLDEDRPLISSVITNRLDAGQALEIDATVIYALGENPGRVLNRDLEIDSPWNTYRNPGLPPTPIGGVRQASLAAAAEPADTPFFFYVVIDEEGRHGFSETFEQHSAKIAQARRDGILP